MTLLDDLGKHSNTLVKNQYIPSNQPIALPGFQIDVILAIHIQAI